MGYNVDMQHISDSDIASGRGSPVSQCIKHNGVGPLPTQRTPGARLWTFCGVVSGCGVQESLQGRQQCVGDCRVGSSVGVWVWWAVTVTDLGDILKERKILSP